MHQTFTSLLSHEQCGQLLSAAQENTGLFKASQGVLRRMGASGNDVLSEYQFLKYWHMPDSLKSMVDASLPAELRKNANEAWLLHFPQGGQLDRYQAAKPLFNCLSIPLNDGGVFELWDSGKAEALTNKAGDAYFFSLANEHQVPVTQQDDWYLCFLFLHHIEVKPNA